MTRCSRNLAIFAFALLGSACPRIVGAQAWSLNDTRRSTEIGFVQEWFHRDLDPESLFNDSRWSTSSLSFTYCVTDYFKFGCEGGASEFEADDFPGSVFDRYSVGATAAVRALRRGAWDISASGRVVSTFDVDISNVLYHKRVRSINAAVNAVRRFELFNQETTLLAGPLFVDDIVQVFPYDTHDPVDSESNAAFGFGVGGRIIVCGWLSVYGFANYVEQVQGGFGVSLHAQKGSF